MRRILALLSFLTPLACAQVAGSNQQPAFNPGLLSPAMKSSSSDTGSRSMDLLLDMAAAASAPEGAANTRKNEDQTKSDGAAKDSRAKLLEELRKPSSEAKDRALGNGSDPTAKAQLPASLTNAGAAAAIATQMSAGNEAGRAVQQNDEIEISIQRRNEIVARQQESAAPAQGLVDTKPFLRTIVAYLRENRGVVIAVGITALLLGSLLSYSVSRVGRAASRSTGAGGRNLPNKASGATASAPRSPGESPMPRATARVPTKPLDRRPQRHSTR